MITSFRKGSWAVASLLVVLLAFAFTAFAQTSNGTIAGVVLDSTGAAITNATVIVTNVQNGESHQSATNSVGAYRVDSVLPGVYNVAVTASGFAETKLTNLNVSGSVITSANATLRPGAQETLTVEAEGETLQTETGEITSTISTREVQDLPIATLNPYALAVSLPGVTTVTTDILTNGVGFSVYGTRPRSNNFLIEGSDNNDAGIHGQGLQPGNLDAIKEVTFLTNSYDAEWGHGGGSVSNLIFKSGTNTWHGAAWDRLVNSSFDAEDKQDVLNGSSKDKYRENIFGFDIGGAIKKDKLFFFASYQWNKYRSNTNLSPLTIPTADGIATLQALLPNPRVTEYLQALGGLVAPTANLPALPLGNGRSDVAVGTYQRNVPSDFDNPELDLKGDWLISKNDTLTLRYIRTHFSTPIDTLNYPSQFPGFDTLQYGNSHNAGITYTHVFTPAILNEARLSYGRIGDFFDYTAQTYANPLALAPTVGISDASGWGQPFGDPQQRFHNTYQAQDALSWTVGKHFFKFGFDYEQVRVVDGVPFNFYGTINYSGAPGYSGLADYIDDYSGTSSVAAAINYGSPKVYPHLNAQAYYFQDTWKLRPNLTLTYGLRYENSGTPGNSVNYPALNWSQIDNYQFVQKETPDNTNFGPRFGFSYTPRFWQGLFGDNKTVVRGGFGVFYDGIFTNIVDNTQASSPNVLSPQIENFVTTGRGTANWSSSIASLTPTGSPYDTEDTIVSHLLSPETLQWNLNVERELPGHFIATLGYVGTRGEHLFANDEINPIDANTGFYRDPNRGFILLRDNQGDSIYHGMIGELERQFSHGLLFRASYTWSKLEDDSSEVFTVGQWSSYPQVQYPENRKATDWGLSAFDHRQRFAVTYVYDLPKWSAENNAFEKGLAAAFVNGWQVQGQTSFQTGNPENIEVGYDSSGDGITNDRPSLGNPSAPLTSYAWDGSWCGGPAGTYVDGPSLWFEGTCVPVSKNSVHWIVPAYGQAGNVGRNSFISPGFEDWDFGIQRTFKIHESHQIDFRAEMFDVFNHGNLGTPTLNNGIGNAATLNLTSISPSGSQTFLNYPLTTTGSRSIRFYIKYSF
ncbi:MAG TPA: carboxypeptidase regulatory-like domain-containing protein [Candidatus Koribacter sp.]|jgi:hypothetical protein